MGRMKAWLHEVTDSFYENVMRNGSEKQGAKATAKEYNISEQEVIDVVNTWEGNEPWEAKKLTDTSSK